MNVLVNPVFWLAALAMYLVMQIDLPWRSSSVFGGLNVVVLGALLGWRAAAAAVVFVLLLWCTLFIAARRRSALARPILSGVLILIAALFMIHKLGESGGLLPAFAPVGKLPLARWLDAISFSFVGLRAVDATVAVLTAQQPLLGPVALAGYLLPFHMLPAGPVGAYRDHVAAAATPPASPTMTALIDSVSDITTGLFYKFVMAECLRMLAFGVSGGLEAPRTLVETGYLLVYVFFDFAGYSLVALGIGRLLGIPTPRNFIAPFAAASLTDFWLRWHASLGAFVRRNLYLPVQLNLARAAGRAHSRSIGLVTLVICFGFVGIWHRLTAGFLLWGAGMGAIMYAEKLVRDRCLHYDWSRARLVVAAWSVVGPAYVFVALTCSMYFVMREVLSL